MEIRLRLWNLLLQQPMSLVKISNIRTFTLRANEIDRIKNEKWLASLKQCKPTPEHDASVTQYIEEATQQYIALGKELGL